MQMWINIGMVTKFRFSIRVYDKSSSSVFPIALGVKSKHFTTELNSLEQYWCFFCFVLFFVFCQGLEPWIQLLKGNHRDSPK